MSTHTKTHHTSREHTYKVVIEMPGNKKVLSFVSEKNLHKLEAFLDKYGSSDSTSWRDLAKTRINKFTKPGLALRGARHREGLSQKELAVCCGISQENISRMENGARPIGDKVAKKLAKALCIDVKLLTGSSKEL